MRVATKKTILAAGIFLACGLIFSSCKKNGGVKPNPPGNNPKVHSDEDSLKLYVYGYMQQSIAYPDTSYYIPIYLWYNQVPVLNPLSTQYDTAENLLSAIISYPRNPSDRYSFLDRSGAITGEIQQGVQGDFGLDIRWAAESNNTTTLWVVSTYKNSSSGVQGVQRGWQITAVNGNTNVSYDGPGYGSGNYTNVYRIINALLYNNGSANATFKKPDGTSVTLTFTAGTYTLTPVMFDTIYNVNGTNVGYFVFNQFVDIYNQTNQPSETKNELDNVFTKFQAAGIKNLIVDLRYNGGGSVRTAEYIDSKIAPASAAGKVMFKYSYNDKMTQYENAIGLPLADSFPSNTGGLNLANVFFITSRNTVSASELTMNNLKPYMAGVKLVGDTTYGKPAGFFTFPIDLWDTVRHVQNRHLADLYCVNFHTVNAQGNGDYYTGIAPDRLERVDNFTVNWGDTQKDPRLAAIVKYIATGSFARMGAARMAASANISTVSPSFSRAFKGMIDYKLSQKIHRDIQPMLRKAHH